MNAFSFKEGLMGDNKICKSETGSINWNIVESRKYETSNPAQELTKKQDQKRTIEN